ncbi:hypothetical protein VSR01_10790 [Actinacidiphila sp. DG2A-62]|uniref:hypothetical protein n=1 Tax=Actinacidiphila sp. DG2A-62 TaxID=3108821 RepID=UPI002DB5ACE9|nr:hypothetical protein [Actinacidiphila sp. DG2A-62]MEC3994005.1 hypothetical protein [Actinacidiphila sp. DG2A-62]
MEPWWAVKGAPTPKASTTTIGLDPDLQIDLPDAGTYAFEMWINYTGGTLGSSDLKLAVNYTGQSTFGVWGVNGINTSSTTSVTVNGQALGTNTLTLGTSGGTFYTVDLKGSLFATGPGNLGLYWAQGTSSATATNLRQGCWMRVTQLA